MLEFLTDAWAHREEIAAWLLAALVASTALVHTLQLGARQFDAFARQTKTPADDKPAAWLLATADRAAAFLDSIASVLPKIGSGARR